MAQKTIKIKLDGRQSYSFPVSLKRHGKVIDETVDIIVRGFLKFEDIAISSNESQTKQEIIRSLKDKTIFYPVLFTFTKATVHNGRILVTILPRSEDLLLTSSDLQIRSQVSKLTNESIQVGTEITPNEVLSDPERDPVTIKIETGRIRTPYKVSIEISVIDDSLFGQTLDVVADTDSDTSTGISLFKHDKISQGNNLLIEFFNNEDWLPSVRERLSTNTGTIDQAIEQIDKLNNFTPFGSSTLFDAIIKAAEILSDNDIDGKRKFIYIFTDNDANLSVKTIDQAIDAVNKIDGDKQVPILVGNLAIVRPITLSVKANISDTRDINKLGFFTGGQSLTLVTEDFVEDIITVFYNNAVGAFGSGTFDFTVDIGEKVVLSNILATFDLPQTRGTGNWEISISDDNLVFTKIEGINNANETINYIGIKARYIRFHIILISGFSSETDEYTTVSISPGLLDVAITFNKDETVLLFLNINEDNIVPSQMVLAVDTNSNFVEPDQIEVGLAKSDSSSWIDYFTESQPVLEQNGKTIIPLRFSQDVSNFQREPLNRIDRFTLKTTYGKWDPLASVTLYDNEDNVISSDQYRAYPRKGFVVMSFVLDNSYKDGDFKIDILNSSSHKIGLRLTNRSVKERLEICGIGKMFTTGRDLLPPLEKVSPEARNVFITTKSPNIYSKIEISYDFFDVNFDQEDISKTEIKWFINDIYISYLDNLRVWNDVDNKKDPLFLKAFSFTLNDLNPGETVLERAQKNAESILKVGNSIHYTIRVSDGNLLSKKGKSNVVKVVQEKPVVSQLEIKSLLPDGSFLNDITANNPAIAIFNFKSDINQNSSEIVWFVDGQEFKRGKIDEGVLAGGGCPIIQICPGEVSSNNLQVGLRMLNEIQVSVTPVSFGVIGKTVTSEVKVVKNSLPEASNVRITPPSPNSLEDLLLNFELFDWETLALDDPSQTLDNTKVQWFRKNPGATEFEEIIDPVSLGQIIVNIPSRFSVIDRSLTIVGQKYFARIIPNDSLDDGFSVDSNTVTISAASG